MLLVKVLTADVEAEDKIDLRTNTAATELVMEDGKAVGVKVKNENGEYTIRAKAVIWQAAASAPIWTAWPRSSRNSRAL